MKLELVRRIGCWRLRAVGVGKMRNAFEIMLMNCLERMCVGNSSQWKCEVAIVHCRWMVEKKGGKNYYFQQKKCRWDVGQFVEVNLHLSENEI